MGRMIDRHGSSARDVAAFYDTLAPDYDAMTGFEMRFVRERPFFRLLVDRYGITTALDAGSGTGFHSLLLAGLGVQVTAADVSSKMVKLLKRHAQEMGLSIMAIESSFLSLPVVVHHTFDALFCMGNSLAHVLTHDELSATLASFAQVLKPGGIFFMQILNYDRILEQREPIQSVKESSGTTFVRYYEYKGQRIRFHILKLMKEHGSISHELNTVELRPILRDELLHILPDVGFENVKAYGSVAMEEFRLEESKDLVISAARIV